jgi:Fe-S-cluster containining protein
MTRKPPAPNTLRFECTGCGGCCTGRGDHYVAASLGEQRAIQRYLGISWRWFRRRYRMIAEDGIESLRWDTDRCVFLDGNRRCSIYPVRPAQCREYPFWPEVVASAASWKAEARRCEGIGRGPVIPLRELRERLRTRD